MPPPTASASHLVLIPSYNTGPKLEQTVRDALAHWAPVWVVVDGSTDGSDACLQQFENPGAESPSLRVIRLPQNQGKGSAILAGARAARQAGFTHMLTMDADGQHDCDSIPRFMAASAAEPGALILGLPEFDASAPTERLIGRRFANFFARFETLAPIGDCLFGFRVYPVADLIAALGATRWARRFDFDPEAAIRLAWSGLAIRNIRTPCRYFTAAEGGISHFNYLRDNVLLTSMYFRLFPGTLLRLPRLIIRRCASK